MATAVATSADRASGRVTLNIDFVEWLREAKQTYKAHE